MQPLSLSTFNTISKNLVITPYLILFATGLMIPSSSNHGFLSIKSLAFISTIASFVFHVSTNKTFSKKQVYLAPFILISVGFLFLSWVISILNYDKMIPTQFDQFKIFLITLIFPSLSIYYINNNFIDCKRFITLMISFNFFYSLIKVLLAIFSILGIIYVDAFRKTMGFQIMSTTIIGKIIRIQTSADIVTPYLLYYVLQSKNLHLNFSKNYQRLLVSINLLAIFLSFSRLLYAVTAIVFFFSFLFSSKKKKIILMIKTFFIAIVLIFALGPQFFIQTFNNRFTSYENFQSDLTRVHQLNDLMQEFHKHRYLGKGLGGYVEKNIRDKKNPHFYEVQGVAFLMQFGLLGACLLLFLVSIVIKQYLYKTRLYHLSYLSLFFMWILSGFTNPFLISLTSGIVYTLFFLTPQYIHSLEKEALI